MAQDIKVGDKIRIVNMKFDPSIKGGRAACLAYSGKED